MQDALATDHLNTGLQQQEQQLRDQLTYWSKAALSYMQQKAKGDWLCQGDRITTYFHAVMRQKSYRNAVYSISTPQGIVLEEPEQIASHFLTYYKTLLGTKEIRTGKVQREVVNLGPVLSLEQQIQLI